MWDSGRVIVLCFRSSAYQIPNLNLKIIILFIFMKSRREKHGVCVLKTSKNDRDINQIKLHSWVLADGTAMEGSTCSRMS